MIPFLSEHWRVLLYVAVVALLCGTPCFAQLSPLSGQLAIDITDVPQQTYRTIEDLLLLPIEEPATPGNADEKSVAIAATMSALLPGAGQIYADAPWWRTAIYGLVEVVAISSYFIYRQQGSQATEDFEAFAREHWDVGRYISWIEMNYKTWDLVDVNRVAAANALRQIYRSTDPSLPSWQQVNFSQLNSLERAISGGFSHTLPHFGEQQYYEVIGKYIQYRSGWDDHASTADTMIFDPQFVTQRNIDYTLQREQANNLLSYADYAVAVLVLNHIVSMVDAGLEARGYNMRIRARLEGAIYPGRHPIPVGELLLTIRF